MNNIAILGATGSIGQSTLKVIRNNPERFAVHSLVANTSVVKMVALCQEFNPRFALMNDAVAAKALEESLHALGVKTQVLSGEAALYELLQDPAIDRVVAAIVGAKGFQSSLAAVRAGKTLLLANKETLVMGGHLFMAEVKKYGATLLPIDSEHNALFQCLPKDAGGAAALCGVEKLILTASGGPFRSYSHAAMQTITKAAALKHPQWAMGAKVTIDSSTLMNKGLEFIEAYFLFGLPIESIEVVIHPQSIIHSLVQYRDGSLLAQLGAADMAIPIAHALGYPERILSGAACLDLTELGALTFEAPDLVRFPCLNLAKAALKAGNRHLVALNAANEVLVAAFLCDKIGYQAIATLLEVQLEAVSGQSITAIDELIAYDSFIRQQTQDLIASI